MRKRKIIRMLSAVLLVLFIFPSNVLASTLITSEEQLNALASQHEASMQALLDERAMLLSTLFNTKSAEAQKRISSEIEKVDKLLEDCGAVFLTDSEALEMIAEKEGTATGNAVREDIPTSSNNTWISTRSSYTYQGVKHNIQTLTAQPKTSSSALSTNSYVTLQYTNRWRAGAQNMLATIAEGVAGSVVSQIPGGSIALLFVDAFGSFNSAFTDNALVDVDAIQYTWAATVTASFKYVRLDTQDDSAQWLSLISTKAAIAVGYQTSGFTFIPEGQTQSIVPTVTQGSRTINAQPTNYNSNNLAVKKYYTYGGGGWQECVRSVKITGPESKLVKTIQLCCPFLPSQCE